jgi:hypothetical protein
VVDPKDRCAQFSENPAYDYFVRALNGLATGEDSSETTMSLMGTAIQGGLPQDDEVLARRFLAVAYLDVAFKHTPGESVLGNPLFFEAFKQLEYSVTVDSAQGYGVFCDPLIRGC